ncbi:twin-arginine translocase TatA/TatE family subunit [Dactylosporangium sp. CA-052675]|uniref:twin-arginine translocase TatA/TatE family subunit n=1 Tax=Dactylosporangium sp. CA-052675 TaxID=3239927 RepID=UPI003D94D6A5
MVRPAKRLPDAARSLGRSMRIIKAETKGLADEDADVDAKTAAQPGRPPLSGRPVDDRPSPLVDHARERPRSAA